MTNQKKWECVHSRRIYHGNLCPGCGGIDGKLGCDKPTVWDNELMCDKIHYHVILEEDCEKCPYFEKEAKEEK
jgi:hypothetical protein